MGTPIVDDYCLEVLIICGTVLVILFFGDPDLHDALMFLLMGGKE